MSSTPATGPTDVATEVAPPVTTTGEPHRHAHAERSRLPMWAAVALTVVSGSGTAMVLTGTARRAERGRTTELSMSPDGRRVRVRVVRLVAG